MCLIFFVERLFQILLLCHDVEDYITGVQCFVAFVGMIWSCDVVHGFPLQPLYIYSPPPHLYCMIKTLCLSECDRRLSIFYKNYCMHSIVTSKSYKYFRMEVLKRPLCVSKPLRIHLFIQKYAKCAGPPLVPLQWIKIICVARHQIQQACFGSNRLATKCS